MPLPLRECSAALSLLRHRSETGPSGKDLAQTGLATAGVPPGCVTMVVPGVTAGVTPQKSLVWGQCLLSGQPSAQVTGCLQWHWECLSCLLVWGFF